jgi:hypothetical protein
MYGSSGFYFLAEVFVCGFGQLFVFAFKPLKIRFSVKRKNKVLLSLCRLSGMGRTKTVTKNKTEGLVQGKGKKDRASLEVREVGIF